MPRKAYRWRPPRRVLVVDEDLQAAQGLAVLLKHLGHDVQLAHDGNAALAAARERSRSSSRPERAMATMGARLKSSSSRRFCSTP